MGKLILVDRTALMQGIWNARDEKCISNDFAERIWHAVQNILYPGPDGRYVCEYDQLLCDLAKLKPNHWAELSRLWEYLGKSISSGSWINMVSAGKE